MVTDPRYYEFSSLKAVLNNRKGILLEISYHKYYLKLGRNQEERRNQFLYFEDMYIKGCLIAFY